MGREATITYEQVAGAAEALHLAGGKPTSRAVRERLGNTGSMGTINKLLQEWRAAQERHSAHALALPPTLQRAILEFMGQELVGAKAALEAELAEQKREAAEFAADNDRQAAEIDELAGAQQALRAELATLQGRISQTEAELAAARAETAREREAAAAARVDLAKALLRLEALPRLEADLAGARAGFEQERQGRVAETQRAAVLEARLDAANERAGKAEAAAEEARAATMNSHDAAALEAVRADTAQHAVATLTGKLEAMQVQIRQQALDLDEARQQAKRGKREP